MRTSDVSTIWPVASPIPQDGTQRFGQLHADIVRGYPRNRVGDTTDGLRPERQSKLRVGHGECLTRTTCVVHPDDG